MTKFFIKYTPARLGITGAEYLPQFLEENFPTVTFDSVISDNFVYYGILEGTGDLFSNSLTTILGRFSAVRLFKEEFIGICFKLYNPAPDLDNTTPPTFSEFMQQHNITTTNEEALEFYKKYRTSNFKEISKRKCEDDNDGIADLGKCVALLTVYYDILTPEEKTIVDLNINKLKQAYTKESCIKGLDKMVNDTLIGRLSGYFEAKTLVDNATTVEEIDAVVYE